MKTSITILGVFALASSISLAERDDRPQERDGNRHKPNPAKIIEHLDQDGNGSVSKAEFLAGKRAQKNPERAEKAFSHIDADGNGELTTDEFAQLKPRAGREGRDRPNPAKIFKHLDKDGSGSISKDEFLSGERAQKNPEMAAKLFGRLDADGSGDISQDEFAKRPRHNDRRRPGDRPRPNDRDGGANIE